MLCTPDMVKDARRNDEALSLGRVTDELTFNDIGVPDAAEGRRRYADEITEDETGGNGEGARCGEFVVDETGVFLGGEKYPVPELEIDSDGAAL